MPLTCSACGKDMPDATSVCPHCGQAAVKAAGKRGLPTWAKLLVFLLLPALAAGFLIANKPSEAVFRQAIRDKGKELQAKGALGPPVLIDDPKHADRFVYHDYVLFAEMKYTTDDGKVITVASGLLWDITVSERW